MKPSLELPPGGPPVSNPPMSKHDLALGESWTISKCVCLRSAGLPVSWLTRLGTSSLLTAAAAAIDAAEAADESAHQLIATVRREHEAALGETRRALSRSLRWLRKGRAPELSMASIDAQRQWDDLTRRQAQHARLIDDVREQLAVASQQSKETMRAAVADDRFLAAITWQNRRAADRAIRTMCEDAAGGRRAKERAEEMLLVSYLQRYCAKNETIGFFGPQAWTDIGSTESGVAVAPGANLTAGCHVAYESWAIDAFAAWLVETYPLEPWLTPRRNPTVRMEARTVWLPSGDRVELDAAAAEVLRAADGTCTAARLAAQITGRAEETTTAEAVYAILRDLRDRRLITWRFELPLTDRPDVALRRQALAIDAPDVRDRVLAHLDDLECRRVSVGRALHDPAPLRSALDDAERFFELTTARAAVRARTDVATSRGLLYSDCTRDVRLSVGPDVLAAVAGSLHLVLASARWFTANVASRHVAGYEAIFDRLSDGGSCVDAVRFWAEARDWMFTEPQEAIRSAEVALQHTWRTLIGWSPAQRRVTVTCDDIAAAVNAHFEADAPGWPYAKYVSVDLQIAAAAAADIPGDGSAFVLGEVHLGHALNAGTFVDCHPRPSELAEAMADTLPERRVVIVPPHTWPGLSRRSARRLSSAREIKLIVDEHVHGPLGGDAVPIGACVVARGQNGRLVLCSADGAHVFDLVDAFASALTYLVFNRFRPFDDEAPHTPRIAIDRLIVARETWRVELASLGFFEEPDPATRFINVQRWRQAHGMPRWCFFRTPLEPKPIYVDFASPITLELLAARVARMKARGHEGRASIVFSEMLPNPDELWLVDAESRRYTSELRMVFVDGQALERVSAGEDAW